MPAPPAVLKPPASNEVEVEKPSHTSEPAEADSVRVMVAPKGGIQVIALRAGYYKCSRKVADDKFFVSDMSKVGSWMRCIDKGLEQEHQDFMKQAKAPKKDSNEAGE